jgi:predicted nucleotidyltransferase
MTVKTVLNKVQIFRELRNHAAEIKEFEVSRLGLFGSVVRGEENSESDLDFLVEFNEGKKNYNNFIHLAFFLEDIFQKKVDLLTWKSVASWMIDDIKKEIEYVEFNN